MVLLISVTDIKNLSILDENLDDKYIIPNIVKGQDFIIKPLLGDNRYNDLIDKIKNNNLDSNDKELLETYIQPVLVYYVLSEVIYSTAYKMKNRGVENSDEDKFNELVRISKKYLIDSEKYQQILREYMCDNGIVENPEYDGPKMNIFLGKTKNRNWRSYDNPLYK